MVYFIYLIYLPGKYELCIREMELVFRRLNNQFVFTL